MDFTIVIPSFNGPERVDVLLDSIFKFYPNVDPHKIIVSDDCSPRKEETRKICNEKHKVLFTHPSEWSGVGENTNHVVNLAQTNLVFVINDDLVISKGTFETMQKFWQDNRYLKLGAAGFTFIQDHQLVDKEIISSKDKFYPPVWNTGEINYNDLELEPLAFPVPFKKPILTTTPSGPCFAISKSAWEEVGKFHEFGMWEGGAFHTMWEKGYIICMVPTPPLLHAKSSAHSDQSGFLHEIYKEHPERRAWKHKEGERLYKEKRGKGYDDDTAYIWDKYIRPSEAEIYKLIRTSK